MDHWPQKPGKKSPNNIEIRPNFTYSFSRGLLDRFGGGESTSLLWNISINVCTVFCTFFRYLFKKTKLCSTGLETGCKPVLLTIGKPNFQTFGIPMFGIQAPTVVSRCILFDLFCHAQKRCILSVHCNQVFFIFSCTAKKVPCLSKSATFSSLDRCKKYVTTFKAWWITVQVTSVLPMTCLLTFFHFFDQDVRTRSHWQECWKWEALICPSTVSTGKGLFINDVTQIWNKINLPPSVTQK